LAPAIHRLFESTGTSGADLTGLAVAIGPGSFTSLRIGLAAAKGLSLAQKLPIVGVPTLEIIAAAHPLDADKPLIAVLHAGRTRLAFNTYHVEDGSWRAQGEPEVIDARSLVQTITTPTLVCGELSETARTIIGRRWKNAIIATPARCLRRASYLAEIGWSRIENGQADDPFTLAPIYLSTTTNLPS